MSTTPVEGNQPDPALPPGKVWVAAPGDALESVQVLFLPQDAGFDLDAALTRLAESYGGTRTDIASSELGGHPARTAGFVGTFQGEAVMGRSSLAVVGDRLLAVFVLVPSAEGARLPELFGAIVDTLVPT
jgi:hypothetical protein